LFVYADLQAAVQPISPGSCESALSAEIIALTAGAYSSSCVKLAAALSVDEADQCMPVITARSLPCWQLRVVAC